jgi:hypothetical protein
MRERTRPCRPHLLAAATAPAGGAARAAAEPSALQRRASPDRSCAANFCPHSSWGREGAIARSGQPVNSRGRSAMLALVDLLHDRQQATARWVSAQRDWLETGRPARRCCSGVAGQASLRDRYCQLHGGSRHHVLARSITALVDRPACSGATAHSCQEAGPRPGGGGRSPRCRASSAAVDGAPPQCRHRASPSSTSRPQAAHQRGSRSSGSGLSVRTPSPSRLRTSRRTPGAWPIRVMRPTGIIVRQRGRAQWPASCAVPGPAARCSRRRLGWGGCVRVIPGHRSTFSHALARHVGRTTFAASEGRQHWRGDENGC